MGVHLFAWLICFDHHDEEYVSSYRRCSTTGLVIVIVAHMDDVSYDVITSMSSHLAVHPTITMTHASVTRRLAVVYIYYVACTEPQKIKSYFTCLTLCQKGHVWTMRARWINSPAAGRWTVHCSPPKVLLSFMILYCLLIPLLLHLGTYVWGRIVGIATQGIDRICQMCIQCL